MFKRADDAVFAAFEAVLEVSLLYVLVLLCKSSKKAFSASLIEFARLVSIKSISFLFINSRIDMEL